MEESCGNSNKDGGFVQVKYYNLRRTPSRLASEPINSNHSEKILTPQNSSCSPPNSTPKEPLKIVPSVQSKPVQVHRRYPSRVRISAVQNFPSSVEKETPIATPDEKSRIGRSESQVEKEAKKNSTLKRSRKEEEEAQNEIRVIDDSSQHQEEDEISTRKKVRESLHLFQTIYSTLVQNEEPKIKEDEQRTRFDLKAYNLFKERSKVPNNGNVLVGGVPGVEVGDEFHFRVELCILGLHRQFQAGIDFVKQGDRNLAISVVSSRSGQYNADVGKSDVLVYCGGGMRNRDQKLEHGNLALKNSIDARMPVRVIHGFRYKFKRQADHSQRKIGKVIITYIYGGLYLVEKYWRKKEKNGCYVVMFQLRRMPGQPKLDIREVKKSMWERAHSGLKHVDDISLGKEKILIRVANTIDDERPPSFIYTTEMMYPLNYKLTPPKGCDCVNGCSDSVKCACVVSNGGEIPFNSSGLIVEAKPLVYECGPSCKCPPTCQNRVSQHGIKFPLEVFKTESMGWGVRSLTSIPSGSFICEYVGDLVDDEEAEKRTNDEYLFEIGNNYFDESLWEGLSTSIPSLQMCNSCEQPEEVVTFTVDASKYGNIGRFINHHCTPNLYAQNLLYDHDDKRMPHVMLFASEDIPPLQELTYHYNYVIDSVRDSDGNIKKKNCYCGSFECTGRLY